MLVLHRPRLDVFTDALKPVVLRTGEGKSGHQNWHLLLCTNNFPPLVPFTGVVFPAP